MSRLNKMIFDDPSAAFGKQDKIMDLNSGDFNNDATLSTLTNGKVVVMFHMPDCGYCKRMKPDFIAASQEAPHGVTFAYVDITTPQGQDIQNMINSQQRKKFIVKGVPKVVGYLNGKFYAVYAPGDEDKFRTKGDILMFADGIGKARVEKDEQYAS